MSFIPSYPLGEQLTFETMFADDTSTPANPTTVTLTILDPTNTTTAVTEISNPSTGVYTATFLPTIPGYHTYRWQGTGAVVAESENTFEVLPTAFV